MDNHHQINYKKVGALIRVARKEQGLTQEQAAELAFISARFWGFIETGDKRASVNTYRQIAAVLGASLNDLFYEDAELILLKKAKSYENLLDKCTMSERAIIDETVLTLIKAILKYGR